MPQRIRLLATCQVNGAIHSAGEIVTLPDGQRGPHRTVVSSNHGAQITAHRYTGQDDSDASYIQQNLVDVPLYSVIDEGIEKEREEMRVRHAEERNALDHVDDRTALSRKQGEEVAALELRAAESELKSRQDAEGVALKERQERETVAFDKRAETAPLANPPVETNKEELDKRHGSEAEALKEKHAEEARVLEARKAKPAPDTGTAAAPSDSRVADMRLRHANERKSLQDSNERALANVAEPDKQVLRHKQQAEMDVLVDKQEDEIAALPGPRTVRVAMDVQAIRDKNVLLSPTDYAGRPAGYGMPPNPVR